MPAERDPTALHGLVLAAGAGSRMGLPKALLTQDGVPRTLLAARALHAAGCAAVTVVLGARASEARALIDRALVDQALVDQAPVRALHQDGGPARWLQVAVAEDWASGMSASLRAGLTAVASTPAGARADAVVVTLVDLPDVGEAVVRRLADTWRQDGGGAEALVRATYGGRPGHPVLLGRHHWSAVAASSAGDVGAQPYLQRHKVRTVSCDDLATGRDLDRPEDLTDPGRG